MNENVIDFVVMGEPKPWTVFVKMGRPSSGFEAMQTWQELIRIEAKSAMKGREPFTGPIHLKVLFCRAAPKGAPFKGKRGEWLDKHLLMRPDLTNYLKSCEDALNPYYEGVTAYKGVYLDDSQVVKTKMEKEYGPKPYTHIVVQAPQG